MRVFDPIFEWTFPLFDWPDLVFRDLSDRLNLSRDEGEKWIVNLIRETRMGADAKIDLEKVRRVFSFFLLATSFELSLDVIPNAHTMPTGGPWDPLWFGPGVTSRGRSESPVSLFPFSPLFDCFWPSPCRVVV